MDIISPDFVSFIAQVGFPIAVALYLLYERSKYNDKLVEYNTQIVTTLNDIKDALKELRL